MNCLLMEPIVSQVMGVALGNDKCPGWMSFGGAAVVMIAINVMAVGEKERISKDEELSKSEPKHCKYERLS